MNIISTTIKSNTMPATQLIDEAERQAAAGGVPNAAQELRALYKHHVNTLESARDQITAHGGECDAIDVMEMRCPVLKRVRDILNAAPLPRQPTAEPFGYIDSQGLSHAGNSTNFRMLLDAHRAGNPAWRDLQLVYLAPPPAAVNQQMTTQGEGRVLTRYGFPNGYKEGEYPQPMTDGYWTPWHTAALVIAGLREELAVEPAGREAVAYLLINRDGVHGLPYSTKVACERDAELIGGKCIPLCFCGTHPSPVADAEALTNIALALNSSLGDTDPDFGDMSDEEIRDEAPVWWATRELNVLLDRLTGGQTDA